MKTTIGQLAQLFKNAVNNGHAALEVQIHLHAFPQLQEDIEPETGAIAPVDVVRDALGRWKHPAMPASWDVPMSTWLRQRGFDFTVTYLIKPDNYNQKDISSCRLARPFEQNGKPYGNWFCWEINTNADGEPIAVWIAPTE